MSNSNSNAVCFPCRRSYRVYISECPTCGSKTASMGNRIRIPKRNDNKGWIKLVEHISLKCPGLVTSIIEASGQQIEWTSLQDHKSNNKKHIRISARRATRNSRKNPFIKVLEAMHL